MGLGNWAQRMSERKDMWTMSRDGATAVMVMVMLFAKMENGRGYRSQGREDVVEIVNSVLQTLEG